MEHTGDGHLLLIASRQIRDQLLGAAGLHLQTPHPLPGRPGDARRTQPATARVRLQAAGHEIVGNGAGLRKAFPLAILRDESETLRDPPRRSTERDRPASKSERTRNRTVESVNATEQFRAARSHQAREAWISPRRKSSEAPLGMRGP